MIYAGTTVNVEKIRKTKREGFISKFLPQLVFFSEIPIEEREKELGALWDMIQEPIETEQELIPESHLQAIKEIENEPISKGVNAEVGGHVVKTNGNSRRNRANGK